MELVLIRHGIAEPGADNQPDADRRLTDKGCRRLEAELPALCLILSRKRPRIWTSPLVRARETAVIIAGGLDIGQTEPYDAIASGSLDALARLLSAAGPNDCIVIVGHQPHLGAWSSHFCGLDLPFKKGAAAAFRFATDDLAQGELLWFLQPGTLRRMSRRL